MKSMLCLALHFDDDFSSRNIKKMFEKWKNVHDEEGKKLSAKIKTKCILLLVFLLKIVCARTICV